MNKLLPASILAAGLVIGGAIITTRTKPVAAPVAASAPASPGTCSLVMSHESNYSPSHKYDDGPTTERWMCNGKIAENQDELTAKANGARTVNCP